MAGFFFALTSFAEVDLSPYNLTPEQIEIIRKLEARKTVSEENLLKLAKISHDRNLRKKEFVPSYTIEQLRDVRDWAVGGVLRHYAETIGLSFDFQTYLSEYPVYIDGQPYLALFNFGFATGTEIYPIDIMATAINLEAELAQKYALRTSDQNFIHHLAKKAKSHDMSHLISFEI